MKLFNKPKKHFLTDEQVPSPCHCSRSHPPFVRGRWITPLVPSTALLQTTALHMETTAMLPTALRRWYII